MNKKEIKNQLTEKEKVDTMNFPYDIVHEYSFYSGDFRNIIYTKFYDETLEDLWKNLPDYLGTKRKILTVQKGSGSMYKKVSESSTVQAIEVSAAVAIYTAQGLTEPFKNQFITFSSNPQWIDLTNCSSLKECIDLTLKNKDCSNINIEAVYDMILQKAVHSKVSQDDLPESILIVSNTEFDDVTYEINQSLFDKVSKRYAGYGYKMPGLIFWNVCSDNTILSEQNQFVTLVGGFSPSIFEIMEVNLCGA